MSNSNFNSQKRAKYDDIKRILKSNHPSHRERKFLVHFLRALGLSDYEIFWKIDRENKWDDFNKKRTLQQILSLKTFLPNRTKYEGLSPRNDLKKSFCGGGGGESFTKLVPFKGNKSNAHLLRPYNKEFLFKAKKIKFGILKNNYEIFSPYPNDSTNSLVNAIYRYIEGIDHILLVIDIDREGNLHQAYKDLKLLINQYPIHWTWLKFSGYKGFHAIRKIPLIDKKYDYGLLKEIGIRIENKIGIEIDKTMFQPNRLIRTYSVNFKSGLCSVPINPDIDTLEDILHRAETLELSRDNIKKEDI